MSFGFEFKDTITYEDIKAKPELGCLCYGMYLEGCKWDYNTHALAESDPKKLFVEMPMIHFIPVTERAPVKTGIYECPIYKVTSRTGTLLTTGHSTNFVMIIEIPSTVDQDFWIKSGVAGFLALRY